MRKSRATGPLLRWTHMRCRVRGQGARLRPKSTDQLREAWMTTDRRVKVLVVDDHDMFRTGLRALLEEEGFEALDASSGELGVRRARSFSPDVMLVDMNMPGMSGVEATPLLREAA